MKRFLPFLCCLLFLAGCTSAPDAAEPAQAQFFSMDTVMSIRVYSEASTMEEADALGKRIMQVVKDMQ